MLETSCLTNFRITRLQFRGVGLIWLIRELPRKNLLCWGNSFKGYYYCMSPKCLKSIGKMKTRSFRPKPGFRQSWTKVLATVLQYSYFSVISRFPLKTVHHFRNFLSVLSSPTSPYIKLKLGKNSGYTCPTLFVGGGEGLELYELENAPETQKCPKNFVHECSYEVWHFKLVSLWCGRTDGRTVPWLPKFLEWIDYS